MRTTTAVPIVAAVLWTVAAGLMATAGAPEVHFARVRALKAEEGVFAYARISPNGRLLVYASEMPDPPGSNAITRTVTVVDLTAQKILFTEPGIDGYWSNDGTRMIYRRMSRSGDQVAIRREETGAIAHDIAPVNLGDYYSWAVRDGRNLILTIMSNYYYLDGDQGVMPFGRVPPCPGIGVGERPLISKDGRRITTFVRGDIVVRDLTDCENILDTGIQGAKADFSWDGRYIAFHVAKPDLKGYAVQVVDTIRRTVRTVTANLPGSSLFPSWTQDGRLCFRYDGDDYRGFVIADHVLDAPERPLPSGGAKVPAAPRWADVFPETALPPHRVNLVMIWATWSAHSPQALVDLQRAGTYFRQRRDDVGVLTALEIGSLRADVDRTRQANGITLPEIPLAPARLTATEALNQIPTTMLFKDGAAIDRRLGAQSFDDLRAWVGHALALRR